MMADPSEHGLNNGRRTRNRRVVIVWRNLPHYRVKLYQGLRQRLLESHVPLKLLVGRPSASDTARRDQESLEWAQRVHTRHIRVGDSELLWQPITEQVQAGDFVIAEQGSKNLVNYWLHLQHRRHRIGMAYWGHGVNLQARLEDDPARRATEAMKRALSRRVDWWFAYTRRSVEIIAGYGFPRDRITDVQNSIDTTSLSSDLAATRRSDCAQMREQLGLSGERTGLFIGGLYPDKNIDFLLASADEITKRVPDFELIVIGDGPEMPKIRAAAATRPWLHHPGAMFGRDKAAIMRLSRVMMVPYAAGLVVLDSLVAAVPLAIVDDALHGPEVAYLTPGEDSLVTPRRAMASDYADAVARLLVDESLLRRLGAGCGQAGQRYSIENMVDRFAGGVLRALETTEADAGRR